jgi:threonine synthase
VSDAQLLQGALDLTSNEGVFAAPEGGACVAAVGDLIRSGFLLPDERTIIYNTGSGVKYLEAFSTRFPRFSVSEADKLGGLITPR